MNTNPVWFVASVGNPHRSRTWGFFHSPEEAESYVMENSHALAEGRYYTHAIIERVEPGCGYAERIESWYELHNGAAAPCEKPASRQHVVCFTVG